VSASKVRRKWMALGGMAANPRRSGMLLIIGKFLLAG
jgi:hypothetical protein